MATVSNARLTAWVGTSYVVASYLLVWGWLLFGPEFRGHSYEMMILAMAVGAPFIAPQIIPILIANGTWSAYASTSLFALLVSWMLVMYVLMRPFRIPPLRSLFKKEG